MSERYAIISNGKVINVVEGEPEYAANQGWVKAPEDAGMFWVYDPETGVFSAPVMEPVAPLPAPTKEDLLAQLQALQAQITALGE